MLELLTSLVLIRITYGFPIDLCDIWEPIDDEGPEEYGVRHFIALNRK